MNRYRLPLLAAAVALSTVAAVNPLHLFHTHEELRQHAHKQPTASQIAPTTPVIDAPCVDGMADVFPCDGVDLLSYTPVGSMTGIGAQAQAGRISDVWGWTDPETGDEYVLLGKLNGAGFFRVTDPTAPVYLGDIPGGGLVWFDIKVYADHAYVVSESPGYGMKVFDLTRLRGVDAAQDWIPDFVYPLTGSAHNLAINEDSGYAYVVGGNNGLAVQDHCLAGLHMIDLSMPGTPVFAGCYSQEGGPGLAGGIVGPVGELSRYVHDTHCVIYDGPDADHHDREICFNSSETHLSIVDVTDKLASTLVASVDYPFVEYAHQGWLTDDRGFFLMGDEGDESGAPQVQTTRTLIFDVRDLDAPKLHGEHFHETPSIDHNMYTDGPVLYQSNYTSGLRVLDTLDVEAEAALHQLAFFDVYPENDNASFNGSWSNYPYFDSGTVAVSSYEGLFLVRVQDAVWDELAERIEDRTEGGAEA